MLMRDDHMNATNYQLSSSYGDGSWAAAFQKKKLIIENGAYGFQSWTFLLGDLSDG